MDPKIIKKNLTEMLEDVAAKARSDAQSGESDISSVFEDMPRPSLNFDIAKIEEAIRNIDKATATKDGARRLLNGILLAARIAAKVA